MYVGMCMCDCRYPQKLEKGIKFYDNGVTNNMSQPIWVLETNLCFSLQDIPIFYFWNTFPIMM